MRDWSYKLAILTVNTSDTVRDPTLGLPRIRMQMETVTRAELITQGCVWYMMLVSANFGRLVLGCIEADFCQ